jgi:hypothetical protein
MAVLTLQTPAVVANAITRAAAAAAGDSLPNSNGKTLLSIKNSGVASRTVTVATQITVEGLAVADNPIVIAAGEEHLLGPFRPDVYNDVDDRVQLTYSSEADLTVAALSV